MSPPQNNEYPTFPLCMSTNAQEPNFSIAHSISMMTSSMPQRMIRNQRGTGLLTRSRSIFNSLNATELAVPLPSSSTHAAPSSPVISNLEIPIVSDWVCAICMEGDSLNPNIVEHDCGRHSYHISCMFDNRNTDPRCALCRQPEIANVTTDIINETQVQDTNSSFGESIDTIGPTPPASPIIPLTVSTPLPSPQSPHLNSLNNSLIERPSFLQPAPIIPGYRRRYSFYRTFCTNCIEVIPPRTTHATILPCRHHIHDSCLVNIMLSRGFTNAGRLTCTFCTND